MARRSIIDTLLTPRVSALRDALPLALDGDAEGVHQLRVASRRVREALPICGASLDPHGLARLRKAVRRVTRAFGEARELDVSLWLFEERLAREAIDPAVATVVRRGLVLARSRALGRARKALPPARVRALDAALEGLMTSPSPSDRAVAVAIEACVARRVSRVRHALATAGTLYVPERLHTVRIAVKQLRYASELAGEARRARASSRVAALRAIQDLLGLAHDLHVLAEQLAVLQRRAVRSSRRTARAIGRTVQGLDAECRQLHAAFLSRRPALLALCATLDAARPRSRKSTAA